MPPTSSKIERRALQACIVVGGCVPVGAGLSGALLGSALTGDVWSVSGDNHMRYLSGLLFALGLGFWSTIVGIEHKQDRMRLLTFVVAIGGLFRLLAIAMGQRPSNYMQGAVVMELIITPLLCVWQARVARR